jgi:hypothetical protein
MALIFSEVMIVIKGSDDVNEFSLYINIINVINGIFVSKPKITNKTEVAAQAQVRALKHRAIGNIDEVGSDVEDVENPEDKKLEKYINFVITTLVYMEVLVFAFVMLGKGYKDNLEFTVYSGLITNIIGIYVSKPKYSSD